MRFPVPHPLSPTIRIHFEFDKFQSLQGAYSLSKPDLVTRSDGEVQGEVALATLLEAKKAMDRQEIEVMD